MPTPLIIGHRGASLDAPENSLTAFRLAFAQGADGIEADFRLSRDGEILCLHDPTTGRMTGKNLRVSSHALAELRQLSLGGREEEKIPTLAEILAIIPAGKKFFLEIKCGVEIIPPLRRLLASVAVPAPHLSFLSFDARLLAALKQEFPTIPCGLNVEYHRTLTGRCPPRPEEILKLLAAGKADSLSLSAHPDVDGALIRSLHATGREIHIWTVDLLSAARHYQNLGVDSLMTNRPGGLRQELLAARS